MKRGRSYLTFKRGKKLLDIWIWRGRDMHSWNFVRFLTPRYFPLYNSSKFAFFGKILMDSWHNFKAIPKLQSQVSPKSEKFNISHSYQTTSYLNIRFRYLITWIFKKFHLNCVNFKTAQVFSEDRFPFEYFTSIWLDFPVFFRRFRKFIINVFRLIL